MNITIRKASTINRYNVMVDFVCVGALLTQKEAEDKVALLESRPDLLMDNILLALKASATDALRHIGELMENESPMLSCAVSVKAQQLMDFARLIEEAYVRIAQEVQG